MLEFFSLSIFGQASFLIIAFLTKYNIVNGKLGELTLD